MPVSESQHPLVKHKLSLLRKIDTSSKDFRDLVGELGSLLTYEATMDLPLDDAEIETWQGPEMTPFIAGKKLTLVPILRAGLGLLDGVLRVVPNARVSVVGIKRDEESLEAVQYYENLAPRVRDRMALILDPMLATGGTLIKTISGLKKAGCTDIRVLTLIAAPEGIKAVEASHPDVRVFVGNVDRNLNDRGYIIPGLGDAGDRLFGTQQKGRTSRDNLEDEI